MPLPRPLVAIERESGSVSDICLKHPLFTQPGPLTDLGSSPCHTAVDLAAKRNKIDGLGQECLGSAFKGFSPGIRVAVGSDHDDGDVGSCCLGLRQKLKTGHSRHVDVGKDQDQRCSRRMTDQFKRAVCRLGNIHRKAAVADVASELLAKQRLDIGFVVNNKNKQAHLPAPALPVAAVRGRMTLNSVNSPGWVSTSIDPPCCLTTMS